MVRFSVQNSLVRVQDGWRLGEQDRREESVSVGDRDLLRYIGSNINEHYWNLK